MSRCGVILLMACASMAQPSVSIYEQAASYIQRSQPGSAVALLEPKLKENPQDLKARTLMGMALAADNRRAEANRHFLLALESQPNYAPALRNLALNEMAMGQTANARSHFEKLLKLSPSDPLAHLALGGFAFAAGDYDASVSHYSRSGELYRRDPAHLLKFAEACVSLKQGAKASEIVEQLPADADAAAHFAAGGLLAKLEKFPAAAREFELARSKGGNTYDAAYNLLLAQVKAHQNAEAVRTGQELIAQGHGKAEVHNLLAQALENQGKTKEAYEALRQATKIDPGDPSNYADLIGLCITHKNFDLALEIADIGVARLPRSDQLHLQRGIALAMKERFDDARSEFDAAVKLAPGKSLGHIALGLILMQMDRAGEAVTLLRERAQAGRGDYLVLWFLGEALNRSGALSESPEEAEALNALARSVELNPGVPQARVLLAKLLARRGQLDLAVQHLTRALELDPENVSATYQLAQVYQKKGNSTRARELFAKVSKAKAEDREQFTRGGLAHIVREGSR